MQPVELTNWGPTRCLIAATAVAGLVGVPLGLLLGFWSATGQMSTVPWVGLAQAHGQVQLFGWTGLAIIGVTFHAIAHLLRTREAPTSATHAVLALQLLGVVLRVAAPLVPGAVGMPGAWLLVASAAAFLGAFAVTLVAHVQTLAGRQPGNRAPTVLPRYLLVGVALWLVALLANLDGAIQALRYGAAGPGALDATRDAFIVTAVGGGMAMIAAGMSLRVVVGWADLSPPDLSRAGQAWWLLASAVVLRAAVPGIEPVSPTAAGGIGVVGALLWGAGVWWFLLVLRGLWSPGTVQVGGGAHGEADPPLAWYVRTAYLWFALTGVLAVVHGLMSAGSMIGLLPTSITGLADAERHALLLGYLGTLTAGLTGRLPTAFLDIGDAPIARTRGTYRAAWLLLLAATVLRVAAPLGGRIGPTVIALSGAIGSLALWCLLAVVLRIAFAAYSRERQRAAHLR